MRFLRIAEERRSGTVSPNGVRRLHRNVFAHRVLRNNAFNGVNIDRCRMGASNLNKQPMLVESNGQGLCRAA